MESKTVKYFGDEFFVKIDKKNNKVEALFNVVLDDKSIKTFKGVAKCNPDDIFDEKIGMEIALNRCALKTFNFFRKNCANYVFEYELHLQHLNEMYKKQLKEREYLKNKYFAE